MNKIIVYHGSDKIVDKPTYGIGKIHNDYGLGFYTTCDLELAKEWAVDVDGDGYANKYELDLTDLKVLDLSNYNVLNWISILLENRNFALRHDIAKTGKDYLLEKYLIPYKEYDVIIGYRADDSYFKYAEGFLNNSLSVEKLEAALNLGNLGNQIVLKSEKAFKNISYINCEKANKSIYYPLREKRNEEAKSDFEELLKKNVLSGIYLIDIIRRETSK